MIVQKMKQKSLGGSPRQKHLAKERGIESLTEGTEKQHFWFVFPFVDQTDMSDRHVRCNAICCFYRKIGGRKNGNI